VLKKNSYFIPDLERIEVSVMWLKS